MGLLSRLTARRQLRRSARQSLETIPGWIPTPRDRRYGPAHPLPPAQYRRYGLPPQQIPPQAEEFRWQVPPQLPPRQLPPPPLPPTAQSSLLPAPVSPAAPPPEPEAPAGDDGQQFERLATSAAARIHEILQEGDHHPSRTALPAALSPEPGPPPAPASPAPNPTPQPAFGLATERPPAAAAGPSASPITLTPTASPAAPSALDPAQVPMSAPAAAVSDPAAFPPCPTWPYTRKVRLRRRRRRRSLA